MKEDGEGEPDPAGLIQQLHAEADTVLASELDVLQKIAGLTESVQAKLTALYMSKFPKCCATCGREFPTRESYLQATLELAKGAVVNRAGVQEYRNCVCGSTLMVWTKDRRDTTPFGVQRRELFDTCLAKLKGLSPDADQVLRERLRQVFRGVTDKLTVKQSDEA